VVGSHAARMTDSLGDGSSHQGRAGCPDVAL